MTLPLTPETLAAAYDYLRTTPPFSRWNLPEAEDVVFVVDRNRDRHGCYWRDDKDRHCIGASSRNIGRTSSLIELMAHEIIHLHQGEAGMATRGAEHNAAFRKLAERVCAVHGFDPKLF